MNKKRAIDLAILVICLSVLLISDLYDKRIRQYVPIMWISGILALFFFVMAIRDSNNKSLMRQKAGTDISAATGTITEIVLLNEEDNVLSIWDIYGKTAVVIGRDIKENQVDIDLNTSPYASMVEIEHAVMNFSAGNWFIEDLGSKNGIRIKKSADGKIYQLAVDIPCMVECGDIIYVGLNRLLIR